MVSPGDEPSDVEELDRDRPPAIDARAMIRLAPLLDAMPGASAVDLKVANRSLRVDGREAASNIDRREPGLVSEAERYAPTHMLKVYGP